MPLREGERGREKQDQNRLRSPVSKCSSLPVASGLAGLEEGEVDMDRGEEWPQALWTPQDGSWSKKVVAGVLEVERRQSGKGSALRAARGTGQEKGIGRSYSTAGPHQAHPV